MKKQNTMHQGESTLYLVRYDIPNDRRRTKVHSTLMGYGTWVQYSVFECFLTLKQRLLMDAALQKLVHHKEDTLRIYGLCQTYTVKVHILGHGDAPKETTVYFC